MIPAWMVCMCEKGIAVCRKFNGIELTVFGTNNMSFSCCKMMPLTTSRISFQYRKPLEFPVMTVRKQSNCCTSTISSRTSIHDIRHTRCNSFHFKRPSVSEYRRLNLYQRIHNIPSPARMLSNNSMVAEPSKSEEGFDSDKKVFWESNEWEDEFGLNDDDMDDENDTEETSSSWTELPWKDLLEIPGRASWRVSDPIPQHIMETMYQILDNGDRTTKQLRRAHRKITTMHTNLAELRERERRRIVNGPKYIRQQQQQHDDSRDRNKPKGLVYDFEDDDIHPVYYGFDETLAALKHRFVPNYAITKRVLLECQSLLGGPKISSWKPKRILDFGIGCGSATAAAIDVFGYEDDTSTAVEWVHGIDPSLPMRECSRKIIEEMIRKHESKNATTISMPPRVTFSNSLSASSNEPSDDTSSTSSGAFDLALFVYTATELVDVTSQMTAAALCFEKLKSDGIFIMIEPGTPDGFNSIRAVRNMLLDCCPPHDADFEWDDRCHILAPCTHNGSCPMERHRRNFLQQRGKLAYDIPQDENALIEIGTDVGLSTTTDDENILDQDFLELTSQHGLMSETQAFDSSFCSFVHYVPGDKSKKGEKLSYLVAQKKRFSQQFDPDLEGDRFCDDNATDLLARAYDAASQENDDMAQRTFEQVQETRSRYVDSDDDALGFELIRGEEKRGSMGRIIRAPIKKKGHVYIDYCAAPGRIVRSRVTKAMSNNIAPGIFSAARKSRWGGLWPDTMDKIFSYQKSNEE